MGWGCGDWGGRDVGYLVPAWCDHPDCLEKIDRGLSYVCGGEHGGAGRGCGLYFCENHLGYAEADDDTDAHLCERCRVLDDNGQVVEDSFDPKPDHPEWIAWKLTDESWATWRAENPEQVAQMQAQSA